MVELPENGTEPEKLDGLAEKVRYGGGVAFLKLPVTLVSVSGVHEPFPRITQTGGVPTTLEGEQLESVWKPTVIAAAVVPVIL
jgi:hypothetical protein